MINTPCWLGWTDAAGIRQPWGQRTHLGCERLHLQADGIDLLTTSRLPAEAAAQARALLQFGRLIGNSDLHVGNLSLAVASHDAADLASPARPAALHFRQRAVDLPATPQAFQRLTGAG